jgi:isopenicillin N synthase-like dioxygenase
MIVVPTVDISDPTSTSLQAIDAACREHGFFLLSGHGLDDLISQTWIQTRRFFDADRSVRTSITRSQDNPLGYFDRELTKRKRDTKEVLDFIDPTQTLLDARNQWPDGLPDFKEVMVEFFDAFSILADRTLSLLHDALQLTAHSRSLTSCARTSSTVRLNHYPIGDPVPVNERDGLADLGETALGYHTDPGVLTLLLQDNTGGLQTQARDGHWIDIAPTDGTIVVNLGDMMQAWTNDRYRAAIHRVVPMTTQRRFSIPYFSNPQRDAIIEPIPELCTAGPRYRPIQWRSFMAARAYDNFTDLGTDDTQVSDYQILERI